MDFNASRKFKNFTRDSESPKDDQFPPSPEESPSPLLGNKRVTMRTKTGTDMWSAPEAR